MASPTALWDSPAVPTLPTGHDTPFHAPPAPPSAERASSYDDDHGHHGSAPPALDAPVATSLLLDALRRLALDGRAPAALPPALELFALSDPAWLGRQLQLVAWAAVWCDRPDGIDGLLFVHATHLRGACAALWAVRSTAPPAGVSEPLATAARRARLIDGIETTFARGRGGGSGGDAHAARRSAALAQHDRFWGALAAAPPRLRALAPETREARDALARALVGAACAAAPLPAQLTVPTLLGARAPALLVARAPLECVRALSTARRCPILCVLELARATDARADGTCLRPAEPGATTAASRGRAVALDLLPASSTSVAVRLGPRGASGARALDPTVRSWAEMTEVLRASSAASALGGWAPLGLIVKAEASMAVEQLVQRLLCEAQAIFELERAPLRLRPYEVRCYGPSCGFVEFVPDAPSLHALRQRLGSASLSVHWRAAYGERGSAPHARALANFASSLAAYGATCYALAVKDRHNGNILLHASGHLVHVDFGYVLGDAPGGRVERAPFKLTAEWLELLSGGDTEAPELRRFRTLCAVALLALRRHAHRLLAPLETAAALCARGGAAAAALLPCMCAGDASVCAGVRARLMLELDDDAACAAAERLVDASAESWGTWAYDAYQRVAHGIE